MDILTTLSVFLLLSSSWFPLSQSHRVKRTRPVEQREFDYFLLALQWRGTICHNTKHCCASNGCCSSNATSDFTIHGLWTNYNDGTWPACCNGAEFDIKEITPLLGGLKKYWPSLSCSSSSTCHGGKGLFWAHEWEKHGTCAFPIFRDEYSYFIATLNLYLKYNVTEILIQEGYVPSNSEKYPLGGIVSAIQNVVRATPKIVCSHAAIQELYICFYKNFEPRDCVDSVSSGATGYASSSCPKYVSLPEYGTPSLASRTSTSQSSRWGAI